MNDGDEDANEQEHDHGDGRRHSHQLRDILAKNGFQFLARAADELGSNPAEASIHLCSGLELLMKARLAHEHWTLVDSHPGARPLATIYSGDFVSVSFSDAIQRLGAVAGANFKEPERDVLEKASKHRNRVVHFFHRDMEREAGKQEAAVELCQAWGIFERRIRGSWKASFPAAPLDQLHDKMRRLQPYLRARFADAEHKLRGLAKAGRLDSCGICGFESSVLEIGDFQTTSSRCEVCGAHDEFLLFKCPECNSRIHLQPEIAGGECTNEECSEPFELSDICSQIGVEDEPTAFCDGCYMYAKTAYFTQDGLAGICLSCLQVYDSPPVDCARCSEPWVGKDEEDLSFGCPECFDAGRD